MSLFHHLISILTALSFLSRPISPCFSPDPTNMLYTSFSTPPGEQVQHLPSSPAPPSPSLSLSLFLYPSMPLSLSLSLPPLQIPLSLHYHLNLTYMDKPSQCYVCTPNLCSTCADTCVYMYIRHTKAFPSGLFSQAYCARGSGGWAMVVVRVGSR